MHAEQLIIGLYSTSFLFSLLHPPNERKENEEKDEKIYRSSNEKDWIGEVFSFFFHQI